MRRPTRTGLPLWLEITLVLTLKAALLWWAWSLWFSQPVARHMTVPEAAVTQKLLGQPIQNESQLPENNDATRR